jgi:hypothetical protein
MLPGQMTSYIGAAVALWIAANLVIVLLIGPDPDR